VKNPDESDIDYKALGEKLDQAIQSAYPPQQVNGQPTGYCCIVSLYSTYLVYDCGGESWCVQFTLDPSGEPILGARTKVEVAYVPVAEGKEIQAEISESYSMDFSAKQASEKGWVWDVQMLRSGPTAGTSDLGSFYPELRGKRGHKNYLPECLEHAVSEGLFNLAPMMLRTEDQHKAYQNNNGKMGDGNSIDLVVGNYDEARIAESWDDPSKTAVRAKLRLKRDAAGTAMKEFLEGRVAEGATIPYELSITGDALIKLRNPESANPILDILRLKSVKSADGVIRGNAGGYVFHALSESLEKTMLTPKQKMQLAIKAGKLAAKFPKKFARLAEADDDEGGAAPEDIETLVAEAFLADPANAPLKKMFPDVATLLKQETALASIEEWIKTKLAGPAEPDADDTADKAPEDQDAGSVAESRRRQAGKPSPLDVRISELETKMKADNEANIKRMSESYLSNSLREAKHLPEKGKALVTNMVKNQGITDSTKIDAMIREVAESMAPEGAVYLSRGTNTPAEEDKWKANVLNLLLRGSREKDPRFANSKGIAARVAESIGFDPTHRQYNGINSLRDMLQIFDGIGNPNPMGGFGIDPKNGRVSESYDAGITSQIAYDAMYLVLQAEWDEPDLYDAWRKITNITPANNFLNVNTENFGYFDSGNITERTDQTADYAEMPLTGAENAPYAIKDYGFLFTLFWRDFVNDNVGKFQKMPREMAQVFKRQLYYKVMDAVWGANFTTWSGFEDSGTAMAPSTKKVCDHSGWGNAPTTMATLSAASLIEGFTGLMTVKQLGSDAVTGTIARYLLTPMKSWTTAYNLTSPMETSQFGLGVTSTGLAQQAARGITALKENGVLPLEHIFVPEWDGKGSTYDRFFLMAEPKQQECLNVFLYSNIQEPLLQQEATATGKQFTANAIRFKVMFPNNAGFINPRGIWGNSAS
jgi:hypothetical protein